LVEAKIRVFNELPEPFDELLVGLLSFLGTHSKIHESVSPKTGRRAQSFFQKLSLLRRTERDEDDREIRAVISIIKPVLEANFEALKHLSFDAFDVSELVPTSHITVFGRALQTEKHDFDTVVLASLDWVEPLIWKTVCQEAKVDTIEQYAGGYGKGYVRALDLWRTLIKELSVLNEKMHILLIGHTPIATK
jgi:AAA domain